jgi:hypothetical protein
MAIKARKAMPFKCGASGLIDNQVDIKHGRLSRTIK